MPQLSKRSLGHLRTCHSDLRDVAMAVIKIFDFAVIEGHRGEDAQNEAYEKGLSKLRFPQSGHNKTPSEAVHFIPYPIDWEDRERMTFLAGHVLQAAHDLGVQMRWGGDWDRDSEVKDNKFDDLTHYELTGPRKRKG